MLLSSPPRCRVVSAETKSNFAPHDNVYHDTCRIYGRLEVVGVGRRPCAVRGGSLELGGGSRTRVPLRGLHLVSGGRCTFRLLGQGYCLTFRTDSDDDYWRWVKCLAAELLRQTPLNSLPYLDILGITGSLRRVQSEGCLIDGQVAGLPDLVADTCKPRYRRRGEIRDRPEAVYPPVRERLRQWEELCRSGGTGGSLSNLPGACGAGSVRQLCRLFESSTSSLPPRLSSSYMAMKENMPSLLNGGEVVEGRGRKQFRISEMKIRHHSNVR